MISDIRRWKLSVNEEVTDNIKEANRGEAAAAEGEKNLTRQRCVLASDVSALIVMPVGVRMYVGRSEVFLI